MATPPRLLKQWHDRFGAELVGLSLDVLELRVPRPPTDPAEVLAVAERFSATHPALILQLWCLSRPIFGRFGWHHNCKINATTRASSAA